MFTLLLVSALAYERLPPASSEAQWQIVERSVKQIGGSWQIDYQLKNNANKAVRVSRSNIKVNLNGDVSNSSVPGHSCPIKSEIKFSLYSDEPVTSCKLMNVAPNDICKEQVIIAFDTSPLPEKPDKDIRFQSFEISSGKVIFLRLVISHVHPVYENTDPLLGRRYLQVQLGLTLNDTLDLVEILDHTSWLKNYIPMDLIPEDRRDTIVFGEAPYSLHLEAHVPGNQYFRFPEINVKHNMWLRLRFKYLIARNSQGEFSMRINQYKDTPMAWKVLDNNVRRKFILKQPKGKMWGSFDRIVKILPEATSAALEFRFDGYGDIEMGEVWVDEISLIPIGITPQKGP